MHVASMSFNCGQPFSRELFDSDFEWLWFCIRFVYIYFGFTFLYGAILLWKIIEFQHVTPNTHNAHSSTPPYTIQNW